jgi:hypothetical protein
MRFFTMRGPRRPSRAYASLLSLGALSAVLLSGCGGGGGINGTSSSSQGFRIVPAGGMVVPLTDSSNAPLVTLVTQPGLVGNGVQVTAVVGTLPSSVPVSSAGQTVAVPTGQTVAVPRGVYQLTFSPDSPTVTTTDSVTLTLAYAYKETPPTNSTLNIYRYDGTTWTVLPGTRVSSTTATTGSVTAAIGTVGIVVVDNKNTVAISSDLKSGTYAIFATAAPNPPNFNQL